MTAERCKWKTCRKSAGNVVKAWVGKYKYPVVEAPFCAPHAEDFSALLKMLGGRKGKVTIEVAP